MKNRLRLLVLFAIIGGTSYAQSDSSASRLILTVPIIDLPQNSALPSRFPSMQQSTAWSNSLYDIGFWGVNSISDRLFRKVTPESSAAKRLVKGSFNYAVGFAFARYGSELPIPLGVWAHEEYHRSVLGINGIASKNGNWIFSRWDGTVYGVSDEQLSSLKRNNLNGLLYSYVAGVQSENMTTRTNVIRDVHNGRTFYKAPLYLANAIYVHSYFRFATSDLSDSVKVIAPQHEDKNPSERDFAGSDLNAWIHDMFNPTKPYESRDNFPGGEGENRRIGFSDLNGEEQDYLILQKKLSLLNFINPAIFTIHEFKTGRYTSFNIFMQYNPTHFGNDISVVVPVKTRKTDFLFALHNYSNRRSGFMGVEIGVLNKQVARGLSVSAILHGWTQPEKQNFFTYEKEAGGAVEFGADYSFAKRFDANVLVTAKTKGWMAGNPYLNSNVSVSAGFTYRLAAK